MIGARITTTAEGPAIVVQIAADHDRTIPLSLFAAYRELLGIDDMGEVFEAIMHISDNGEPEHDPATGENVWTDAYKLLRRREELREDEADRAYTQGEDQSQIVARSSQAAYDAVHQPINGGECAMDRCRRDARAQLGLPDPSQKCGADSKTTPPPVPEPQSRALRSMRPAGGKAQVLDLLADETDELLACTQRFLHQLSGHDTDHVTPPPPEPEPEPDAVILTADELISKYQEAAHERH